MFYKKEVLIEMESFAKLLLARQSCRAYDPHRPVEEEKIDACLQAARLSPSSCNSQPWHITLVKGEMAKQVGDCLRGMGMNKFTVDCPVFAVVTEEDYNASAAAGAKLKDQDYRSVDIGIMAAQFTLQATELGLGSCILGWFDEKRLQALLGTKRRARLVLALGYPVEGDPLRPKKRKPIEELVSRMG